MKKLALFLALCLLVSSIGLTAFATDDAPIADTPAADAPAADAPAADAPAADAPAADAPAADAPAADAPAADAPAADAPAADTPAADAPAADAPAADAPAADAPAADAPAADAPAADAPAADAPAADAPAADAPAADAAAAADAPAADAPAADVPAADADADATANEPAITEDVDKGADDLKGLPWSDFDIVGGVIQRYKGDSIAITLPTTDKDGNPVTKLEQAVFKGNTKIVSLALEAPIQMEKGSFSGCTSLQSISLNNFLTDVPEECFKDCTALVAVTWSTGMNSIGQGAFMGCTALRAVAIPAGLFWIDDNAFKNCTGLVNIDIPNGVVEIGQGAFQNDTSLENITIPDSVSVLGNSAFQNCTAATKLHLSTALTEIKPFTFSGCARIPEIVIPNGVTTIGTDAFRNNVSAKLIKIPASVTYVGENAFEGRLATGWIRWDDCTASNAIATNGLGLAGYVLAPIDSSAHVYCKNHSNVKFCSTLVRDFVERCYKEMLNRGSDEGGLLDWCKRITDGQTAASLVRSFTNSVEFKNRNLSNADKIEILYKAMLDRPSDPKGKADWLHLLNDVGVTTDRIINGFSGSQEFIKLCKKYLMTPGKIELTQYRDRNVLVTAFVARCYTEALGRGFDVKGLESWCYLLLTKKMTAKQVAHGFIFSPEFKEKKYNNQQFIHRLYRTYFDRDEDAEGMADWLARMAAGRDREYVNNGFTGSKEWRELLKKFGLVE